jgi:hypothetical protein
LTRSTREFLPVTTGDPIDRRRFLWRTGGGLGGVALAWLLGNDGLIAEAPTAGSKRRPGDGLHHPARAKRIVQLFMAGGASHLDTFDYKPELARRNGEPFAPGEKIQLFQSEPGAILKSPFEWRQHGQCGKWASGIVPQLAAEADRIAFIQSMASRSNVHGPATLLQMSGFATPGFPSTGSWISYGLGSLNENLPAFVVLPDARGFASNGAANWSSGFLPPHTQGTLIEAGASPPIPDLFPPPGSFVTPAEEADALELLRRLNREHLLARSGDTELESRIISYEAAAKLQVAAPEALDLSRESEATRRLYGLDDPVTADFGRRCLLARRLLERGVRFVQVWSGADITYPRRNWDSHEDIERDHAVMAASMDRPAAALLKDLAERGLLEDTAVVWSTEFGRMPCSERGRGRDHNPHAFTAWLAGAGVRGGTTFGQSDPFGYKTETPPTYVCDIHATLLHLLGIDHTRLTFRQNGIDRRLTDVSGAVIHEILSGRPDGG